MEQLAQDWANNTSVMLAKLDGLDEQQVSHRYLADKWSVLEHLEHLFVSEKGTARLLAMPAESVERDMSAARERMANGLADLSVKYAGGDSLDPKGRFQSYPEWRAAFIANRSTLLQSLQDLGPDGLCAAFSHPYFGKLTRQEWLVFSMLHADRHMVQVSAMVS
jgi:uncharacterized damage-inducible protein DinB